MKKYGSKNESSFITQGTVSNDTNDTQNSINHDQESNVDTHTHTHTAVNNTSVFMQTAQVTFTSADGKRVHARVYLDPGSSCSYITTALSKQLQLKSEGELTVSNARFEDSQRRVKPYEFTTFGLPASDGSSVPITAFITNNISVALQKLPLNTVAFPILKTIPLADPLCDKPEFLPIDILLGGDFYYDVVDSEQIRLGQGLVLLGSKLGYITAGMVKNGSGKTSETDTFVVSMLNAVQTGSRLCNSDIQQFWSLEDIGIKDDAHQQDDDIAAKQFQDSVEMKDGRYNVRWPWKSGESELPDNRELALSRLRFLKKRLDKQPEVRRVYDATIQQQLKSNIIEPVSENENKIPNGRIHYIPHHCLVKPDRTTTKLRIVYDASSKANSSLLSLNDCLYRGPVFLSNLCGLLLRFRLKTYAVASDIEKAFLQVGLQEIDRDVTRFFWLKDIDKPLTPENLIVYRFVRVLFGVISSPFMLSGTIKHHMSTKNTATAESISDNSYVDSIFNCFDSVDEVFQFYSTAKEYFAEIGMNLREWITNCPELINSIPDVDKGPQQQTKVLGIIWNPDTDTLAAANPKLDGFEVHTKRQLLQATSRIFDPCGWFAPVVVSLKLLVQNLWKIKLGWDDKLPDEFHAQWSNIVDDAKQVSELEIPRCVKTNSSSPNTLHCFCDASGRAYAAAVYLHTDDSVNLIFAKSNLAPTKPIFLPRLELMAAVVGVRILEFVEEQLHLHINKKVLWSDSKCVLSWISSSKVLPVFVANRVKEIRAHDCQFQYIPTSQNPADLPSRGTSVSTLKHSRLWWNGPSFLLEGEKNWPPQSINLVDTPSPSSEGTFVTSQLFSQKSRPFLLDLSMFSSLTRLISVTGWILRFVNNCRARLSKSVYAPKHSHFLDAVERKLTLDTLIRLAQTETIQQGSAKFKNMSRQLGLFRDPSGIWRCRGRLINAELPYDTMCPIFLPKNHPLTKLVIADYHCRCHHGGVQHTLAAVRSTYWIPCGKSQVLSVRNACQHCKLWFGSRYNVPPFPALPDFRVKQAQPFSYVGVDHLGPLLVIPQEKVWLALFTCASTRAIHLEVVMDLSTKQFLLAIRRFVAHYGRPISFISDNGNYFKSADRVLKRLWKDMMNDVEVQTFVSQNNIQWKFIPEYAPWMGGFYERLVGSVKRSLKVLLGRQKLSQIQLQTVVAEISSVLNSRPLVVSEEVDADFLTPAMLLGKRCSQPLLEFATGTSSDPDLTLKPNLTDSLVISWKKHADLLNRFWDIWRSHYLTSLREHSRISHNNRGSHVAANVGDVVLSNDSRMPRSVWKCGLIDKLNVSNDGLARSAVVKLSSGKKVVRPLKLLFPIESNISNNDKYQIQNNSSSNSDNANFNLNSNIDIGSENTNTRPKRACTEQTIQKIKSQSVHFNNDD